jgi:SAM-dependent methyltransferase
MRDHAHDKVLLERFYDPMTSVDAIVAALEREVREARGAAKVRAGDLYSRSLDCQNLGGFEMLEWIASMAAERASVMKGTRVLDLGCGVGGPGRFLADRFNCRVTGIDLLPSRIEAAASLTRMVGLTERVTYHVADATNLPFDASTFEQAWMLDASVHVEAKDELFREIARVVAEGGLLVLHDHFGPLPRAMRPVTRDAPYIAPSLAWTVRHLEASGFRLLLWHDTTEVVLTWMKARQQPPGPGRGQDVPGDAARTVRRPNYGSAYVAALQRGMRTGLLLARK